MSVFQAALKLIYGSSIIRLVSMIQNATQHLIEKWKDKKKKEKKERKNFILGY